MTTSTFRLESFLARYRELVAAVARLARSIDTSPSQLIDELRRRPFAVPTFLRGLKGAIELENALRNLEDGRPSGGATIVDELRAVQQAAIIEVYDIRAAAAGPSESTKRSVPTAPRPDDNQSSSGASDGDDGSESPPVAPSPPATGTYFSPYRDYGARSAGGPSDGSESDSGGYDGGSGQGSSGGGSSGGFSRFGGYGGSSGAGSAGGYEGGYGGGLLGGAAEPSAPMPAPSAPVPAAATISAPAPSPYTPPNPSRWVNAQVEDHPLDDPLEVGQVYVLAFDVDVERRPDAVTTGFSEAGLFSPETDEVELTIQLGGADFEIGDKVRPLRVPREGKSRGKARFDVTPKRAGRVMLVATIHKQGNFVQQIELVYFAVPRGRREADAPRPSVTSVGRPVTAAQMLQPRDISIHIRPTADGYECTMTEGVVMDVSMPVTVPELGAAIDAARAALMSVVERRGPDGRYVFQSGIDIPPSENQWALQVLARAGALLFNRIFHHHAGGTELSEAGNWLRDRANEPDSRLKIQIVAKSFPVPWGLLYVGDVRAGTTLDWGKFLGFRHVIDQLPRAKLKSVGRVIASRPHLAISVNINEGIDVEMKSPLVKDQRTYWSSAAQQHKRLRLTSRTTRAEVLQALGGMPEDDQIAYFYCHADSAALGAVSGPGGSYLVMSNKERITLDDLVVEAPKSVQLAGNPLVFINACESAQLSPVFYDGFVPYFMAKGARGVVGTECNMPALFAAEWARRFFERFLHGESIGDAFFALRREFLEQHRNPLGLLYAVYCDGDTCVSPALSA